MSVARAAINPENVGRFFAAGLTRRVDVGLFSDSNAKTASVTGHAQGMLYAWSMLGCWGSHIAPAHSGPGGSNGWASISGDVAVGDAIGLGTGGGANRFDTAPAEFKAGLIDPGYGSFMPDAADYITNWASNNASNGPQYSIRSQHPLNLKGALRYIARVYRPAAGAAAALCPSMLVDLTSGPGFQVIYPAAPAYVNMPVQTGFGNFVWDIPAGQTVVPGTGLNPGGDGTGFRIRQQRYAGADTNPIIGSFGITFHTLEDPAAFTGVRFSSVMYAGGESTAFLAQKVNNVATDAGIAEYMRFLASRQVDAEGRQLPPMWLVQIIEGGNDAGQATSSVVSRDGTFGTATVVGNAANNTKQGHKNNTQAIITRLRYVWSKVCGFDPRNLFFVLGGYHPQPADPQKTFVSTTMVQSMRELCQENETCAAIDGWQLKTTDNLADPFATANYDAAGAASNPQYVAINNETGYRKAANPDQDTSHMHERFYIEWGRLYVGALMSGIGASGMFGPLTGASSSHVQISR